MGETIKKRYNFHISSRSEELYCTLILYLPTTGVLTQVKPITGGHVISTVQHKGCTTVAQFAGCLGSLLVVAPVCPGPGGGGGSGYQYQSRTRRCRIVSSSISLSIVNPCLKSTPSLSENPSKSETSGFGSAITNKIPLRTAFVDEVNQ